MHDGGEQQDWHIQLGHSVRGRNQLSSGHGDSTWVRQCIDWYEPVGDQVMGIDRQLHAVDASERVAGAFLEVALA